MRTLGLIVNPVAGIGGKAGLKGSDGIYTLRRAQGLGATPEAGRRTVEALAIVARGGVPFRFVTYPREMGEIPAREAGIDPLVIGELAGGLTSADDTRRAARDLAARGVDLLLFSGGDGTARDVHSAIGAAVPVLGIPAGVKMHSAVFAVNPTGAGHAVLDLLRDGRHDPLQTVEAEVMDIDEEAFRRGCVGERLYGYLPIPRLREHIQHAKSGGASPRAALEGIAAEIVNRMEDGVVYVIGPGSTTRSVMDELGLPCTLLGVEAVRNRRLLARDVGEPQLFDLLAGRPAKIVVTAIGGQGHIFGRGNQQISPRVIRTVGRENVLVIATLQKLLNLLPRPLLVDTGDPALDLDLCGYTRVITGYEQYVPYRVGT